MIETKPYRERQKRILYPPKESNRDRLCAVIDGILQEKPPDFEAFLQKLEQEGYEVKRGKYTSVKGKRQKRFIRFRTLGAGYSEEEIRAVLDGKAEHRLRQRPGASVKEDAFQLLIDLAAKQDKGTGYQQWAKKFNLKEMSKTLIFLQENRLTSMDELNSKVEAAIKHFHELQGTIRAADSRMAAWPNYPSCGRRSSTTPRPVRCTPLTARLGTAKNSAPSTRRTFCCTRRPRHSLISRASKSCLG